MEIDFNVEIDEVRLIIRKLLLEAVVQELHENQGVALRDIAAEMLMVASMIVSEPDCEINSDIRYSIDFGSSENEDEDFSIQNDKVVNEENNGWDLWEKFNESEISKTVEKLEEKIARLEKLNKYSEALKLKEELIIKFPKYAETWKTTIGNLDNYYSGFETIAEQMLRSYVVLTNKNKMLAILDIASRLQKTIGNEKMDLEVFEHEYNRFLNDIDKMKDIYKFLSDNPGFPQSKLFKQLSLDGRKSLYMLDWSERFGKITRIRHKDTWLLSIVS